MAERRERFADQLFVDERAIGFSGVEERDAAFYGGPKQGHHLRGVFGWAVAEAHAHAPEPERRDFQIALAELALLHCCAPMERLSEAFLR